MMQTTELRSPTLDPRPAPRRQDEQPRRAAAFEAELAATPEREAPQPRAQDPRAQDPRALEPRSRDADRRERDASARDDAPPAQRRDEARSAANEDSRGSQPPASAGRRDRIEREASGETSGEARAAADTVPGEDEAAPGEGAEAKVQDPTVDPAAMLAPPPPEPPAPPPTPPGQAVSAAVQAAIAAGQQQQQQQQDQTAPAAPPQGAVVAAAAIQAAGAAKAARSNGAPGAAVPQAPADGEAEATVGEGEGGEGTTASEAASQAAAEGPVLDAPKPPRAVPVPQGAQPAAVDPAAQALSGAPGETTKSVEAPAPEAKDRTIGLDAPAPGASPSELQALRADQAGPATETVKVTVTPLPPLQPGAFGGVGQDMAPAQQAGGSAQAAQTPPTPMAMLPIEIGMRAMEGQQRFEIRLSPETLGRIDVRLDIGEDGGVKAHIVVDRADTLGLLQRDARTLERAFEQAGLKTGDGALQFSLGGQSQGGQNAGGQDQEPGRRPSGDLQDRADASARDIAAAIRSLGVSAGGLDIRI
jgi:flagellar hook-length control protein FliK